MIDSQPQTIGVLGGLGPLASSAFLRTIYERCHATREQDLPIVLLHSDPTFPDRTEALLTGREAELMVRLEAALARLRRAGATRLVICCVTMHGLLPRLSPPQRDGVLSLVDFVFEGLARTPRRYLLACTRGTFQTRMFQCDPRWEIIRDTLVLPDAEDQTAIHDMIYRLKAGADPRAELPRMRRLADRYGVTGFVAACTELHLIARELDEGDPLTCLDPLMVAAQRIAEGQPHHAAEVRP